MCAIDHLATQLSIDLFDGQLVLPATDRWNFPNQLREIARFRSDGELVLEFAKWGLEPQWMEPGSKAATYNARSDSLLEGKPLFREAFKRKRCLLFATSFIEHSDLQPPHTPREIIPFDGNLFAYAGLFESAQRSGERLISCSMITCEPNDLIETFHSRMPVILDRNHWLPWLANETPKEDLFAIMTPYPSEGMTIRDAVLPPRRSRNKLQMETLF